MAAMPVENSRADFAAFERRQLALDDLLAGVAVAAVLLARLLLLDEVDHRLRVGKRVGRGAKDRIGDRVARLLPRFAGMDRQGRITAFGVVGRRIRWLAHDDLASGR